MMNIVDSAAVKTTVTGKFVPTHVSILKYNVQSCYGTTTNALIFLAEGEWGFGKE